MDRWTDLTPRPPSLMPTRAFGTFGGKGVPLVMGVGLVFCIAGGGEWMGRWTDLTPRPPSPWGKGVPLALGIELSLSFIFRI
jgi:hypothetical protein